MQPPCMVAGFYTLSQAFTVPEGVLVFLTHLDRMALAAFRPEGDVVDSLKLVLMGPAWVAFSTHV